VKCGVTGSREVIHIDEGMEMQVLITDLEEVEVLQFDQKPIGTSRISMLELIYDPSRIQI